MEKIEILLTKLTEGTLSTSEESLLFQWLRDHKDEWSLSMYDKYRQALEQKTRLLSEERSSQLLKTIHAEIGADESSEAEVFLDPKSRRKGYWTIFLAGIAASLLLVMLSRETWLKTDKSSTDDTGIVLSGAEATNISNNRDHVIPVILPDGSSVLLYPKSTLTYRVFSDIGSREVSLKGKAFFEIIRNPDQPFLVHTNEMVTTVLGTSFMVDAYDDKPRYSVLVKTGSVSVAGKNLKKKQGEERSSVRLKENEEVIFDRNAETFVAPDLLPDLKAAEESIMKVPNEYRFRDASITDILDILSKDYNVVIEADRKILSNCFLTTVLKDKPLFEKLRIICEGVGEGTSFSVEDEIVIVTSLGCNN